MSFLSWLLSPLAKNEDPEVKAGAGPINLNWLFKPWAWGTIVWHDAITSKGSPAQRECITGDRVAENWNEQLHTDAENSGSVVDEIVADVTGPIMKDIQPVFYEGPADDAEREECLKREGRNPDGTKKE